VTETFYAISDRRATATVVCAKHLVAALEDNPTADAYHLDATLLRSTDTAKCDRCDPTPPVTERTDDTLIAAINAALAGDPTGMNEAVEELERRYPEIRKTLDHYHLYGKNSGIKYGEAVIFAVLQTKGPTE
jgi:hypothetical protein